MPAFRWKISMKMTTKVKKVKWFEFDEEKTEEDTTIISKLTKLLILSNCLPVSVDFKNKKAKFSFFCLRTLKYLFFSCLPFTILGLILILPPRFLFKYANSYPKIYTSFDMAWLLFYNIGSNVLAPLWMIILSYAFCNLTEVSLSSLKMFDLSILVQAGVITVMVSAGYCIVYVGHYLAMEPLLQEIF